MSLLHKYEDLHRNPFGPGDQRPTALQVIQDEGLEGKFADKTILITGFSSGLGVETARALAKTGARLYLTVRDLDRGKAVLEELAKKDAALDLYRLKLIRVELKSLESVREAAKAFLEQSSQLNILINNAGIAMCPHGITEDGFEQQFAVNHLAHFLLFQLLKPTLLSSSSSSFHSRVICVSSLAHRMGPVVLGDYNQTKKGYHPIAGYGQSKTCNIWMANTIERLYGSQGLHGISLHPGGVMTRLMSSHSEEIREQMEASVELPEVKVIMKNIEQGSATTVLAAVGSELENKGAIYMEDCGISGPYDPSTGLVGRGYAEWAFDEQGENQLWKDSLAFVGLEN